MIVLEPSTGGGSPVTVWLRPNRSLSRRGLRRWLAGMVVVTLALATWCASEGNVYAPLFALVESAALMIALPLAWRAGDRSERITLDGRSLEWDCLPGHRHASFQSDWVRVRMREAGHRHRLILTSQGGEVEVGAFLGEAERVDAMQTLRMLLADRTAPRQDNGTMGNSWTEA